MQKKVAVKVLKMENVALVMKLHNYSITQKEACEAISEDQKVVICQVCSTTKFISFQLATFVKMLANATGC